jgi:hypothetical protein
VLSVVKMLSDNRQAERRCYNVSEGKIFRNLLEACSASAYASVHHDCPGLEAHAE